jgi:mannose-6-phosphate isomerase
LLVRLSGEIKNYEWGSRTLVQDRFRLGISGEPVAEVWFGTHPAGESIDQRSGKPLSQILGTKLSFLAKFLAAESPLSIQVHPTKEQAMAGFAREQALGLELTNPIRNYKDQSHKPEILVALSSFRALCGFRPRGEIQEVFLAFSEAEDRFGQLAAQLVAGSSLEQVFTDLLEDRQLAESFRQTVGESDAIGSDQPLAQAARDLALELLEKYPGDPGAMVSLMLNHLLLEPGQAIFLPAGNLHAYLSGLGVEVMASSDNVIRGGLTSKHIDQAELLNITDFKELLEPVVKPVKLAEGFFEYEVAALEFRLYLAELTGANLLADLDLPSGAMVICTAGEVAVSTSLEEREVLSKAEVVYLSEAKKFSLSGSGTAFVVLGGEQA